MALHPEKRVTIAEVAEAYGASKNHLVKVVHRLAQLGYLDSTPGRNGGLSLAIPATDIIIGKVVRDMEATLDVVDCQSAGGCPILAICKLKTALQDATQAFLKSLDDVSLENLIANKPDLINLIG